MSTHSTKTASCREYLHTEEQVENDEQEIQSWPTASFYNRIIEGFGLDGTLKII